jgi:hypothetical protein
MSFYPCRGGGGNGIDPDKVRHPISASNAYDTSPLQRLNCITHDHNTGVSTFIAPEDCAFVYLEGGGSFSGGAFKYEGTGKTIYAGCTYNVNYKLGIFADVKKGEKITWTPSAPQYTSYFDVASFIILK